MLELYEPDGAFEALEDYLAPFWGRAGVVADLYLGYGLSAAAAARDDAGSARAVPAAAPRLPRPAALAAGPRLDRRLRAR